VAAPSGTLIQGSKDGRKISGKLRRLDEGTDKAVTMIMVTVDP
jgi:hypothetical protein